MGLWDVYESRANAHGRTRRQAELRKEQHRLFRQDKDTLSYHEAVVDGETRNVVIVNSDNLNEKTMFSLPGEDFDCGTLVEWMENHWLITEKDANNEVYTKVKLLQCDYLLKWVDDDDVIHEQWCVVEDGTKLSHQFPHSKSCVKKYLLNCWKFLKRYVLQRSHEIWTGVIVTKVKRNILMVQG